MSNSYKDPEELLRGAIKAGNQKQKNELIAEALNMYKHKDYETEQRNKGTNNKAINNNIQYNVAAGPNNGQSQTFLQVQQHYDNIYSYDR